MKITLESLGIEPVINAATTYTKLGGTLMPAEVIEAMVEGSRSFVDMHELLDVAGTRIAALTRNKAAFITPGCAAAISLSLLTLNQDPTLAGKRDVLMHVTHRMPYDQAIPFSGNRIKQYGSQNPSNTAELKAAIDENTLAIFWVAGSFVGHTALGIEDTVKIAHKLNIPVIVDAAAQLPPVSNLWHFTKDAGADLALFSGGKALHGPQSTGLMLGRKNIIERAAALAAPNQALARSFKVGKEEIFGILQAVELYVNLDHQKMATKWRDTCDEIISKLGCVRHLQAIYCDTNQCGQPVPRVRIVVDSANPQISAQSIFDFLKASTPRIFLEFDGELYISPDMLTTSEVAIVVEAISDAVDQLCE
jgi:uncharacterized pyridoxal phosphate-dependent enzyme